jgi:multiple sugar transport system permease protein
MLGLAVFEGKHLTLWPELMAANVMVIAPVLLIFALAQRQFIEGINLTGTVG